MLDFPSLVPRKDGGISHTLTWRCNEFVWGPKEIISVVIFDGWQYTPQNEQIITSTQNIINLKIIVLALRN